MGDTAWFIAIAYSVVVALGVLIAVAVWLSTRSRRPSDPEKLAERERTWLVIVVALLVGLFAATIVFIPYGHSESGPRQIVNVTASQFAWKIDPAVLRADVPVEFRLRSTDVNHGFGVYTRGFRLVAQVQVVPGKTQKLVHTFHEAGVYRV